MGARRGLRDCEDVPLISSSPLSFSSPLSARCQFWVNLHLTFWWETGGQPCHSSLLLALHFEISRDSYTWPPHNLLHCLDFPGAHLLPSIYVLLAGGNKWEIVSNSLVLGAHAQWTFAKSSANMDTVVQRTMIKQTLNRWRDIRSKEKYNRGQTRKDNCECRIAAPVLKGPESVFSPFDMNGLILMPVYHFW